MQTYRLHQLHRLMLQAILEVCRHNHYQLQADMQIYHLLRFYRQEKQAIRLMNLHNHFEQQVHMPTDRSYRLYHQLRLYRPDRLKNQAIQKANL